MEAEAILRIRPALTHYLHQYDDCFGRCTARRHINSVRPMNPVFQCG